VLGRVRLEGCLAGERPFDLGAGHDVFFVIACARIATFLPWKK
jgi:hypothetical protein